MARKKQSRTQRMIGETRERLEDVKDRAEKVVKNNPLSSVLVAAAVGAIVGVGTALILSNNRKRPFVERLRDYF